MRTWQQRVRVAVIAAASFVLLVTVLPELASGFGFRSLENRLANTTPWRAAVQAGGSGELVDLRHNGKVTGSVLVFGGPKTSRPAVLGAEACPGSAPRRAPTRCRPWPRTAPTPCRCPGQLDRVRLLRDQLEEPVFLGTPALENVPAGGTVNVNLVSPTVKPATSGRDDHRYRRVRERPDQALTVVVCPATVAFSGGTVPNGCATRSVKPSTKGGATGSYSVTNLPPGSWTAYPGFCARSGCVTHTGNKQTVTLSKGKTTTLNLSTPFLLFGQTLLYGTVTVTGAPSGFSATLGVNASQIGGPTRGRVDDSSR